MLGGHLRRTLVETLGDAYCAELRRTAIGPVQRSRRRARTLPERSTEALAARWLAVAALRSRGSSAAMSIKVT